MPTPTAPEHCKICGAESRPFAVGRVLGMYDVQYSQCPRCRCVRTERPDWLGEAYGTALNRLRRHPSLIPADFAASTGERLG